MGALGVVLASSIHRILTHQTKFPGRGLRDREKVYIYMVKKQLMTKVFKGILIHSNNLNTVFFYGYTLENNMQYYHTVKYSRFLIDIIKQ